MPNGIGGLGPSLPQELQDAVTGLTVLPGVMEDVRRRVAGGGRVGLIYLDLSSEARLESIYGWEVYDGLVRDAAAALQRFRREHLEPEDVVAVHGAYGDELLLFVGLGHDRRAAQEALETLRQSLLKELDGVLRVQFDQEQPRSLTLQSGIDLIDLDPMVRLERAVYRSLDDVRLLCRQQREQTDQARLSELQRIVADEDIVVRYQPIVALTTGRVLGFEALTCGPVGGVFENPELLFTFAEETEHIVDLERLSRHRSIRGAEGLAAGRKLFLNCSARGFTDPDLFCRSLVEAVERCGLAPRDIVLEITERVAITGWQEFRRSVAALRLIGFSIAIDDMGAGYSSLKSVAEVQPEYLKIDLSLVRDVHTSHVKKSLLESLVAMAGNIGAAVIAEGVEKEEEFDVLRTMNIAYAQGYFFASPQEDVVEDGRIHFPEKSAEQRSLAMPG